MTDALSGCNTGGASLRRARPDGLAGNRLKTALLAALIALPLHAAEPVRITPAAGVGVESAALLMSGQQGGEIPFQALALPTRGEEDGKVRVLVRFRMDGPALLEGQTKDVLRIETSLYALGTGGGVQGSVLETIEIDLASQRESVERGGVDLLASLDLKPGAYSLRLLARNLDTGRLGVRTLPVPVPELASLDEAPPLSPPPAGGDPRPTARSSSLGPLDPPPFPDDPTQQSQAAAVPAAPLPVIPDTAEGRKLRSQVRSAYRDALARLAAGREADALAAVAAFEDSLLLRKGRPVPGIADQIIEVETETARELALKDAASLAPLLRLHQRLYEEASVKGRLQGSSVAREAARRLTELSRELGQTEMAKRFSTVFGVELLRRGVTVQGGQMLQSVLGEDPGNEAALLELASSAERRGAHEEAIPHLQALLRAHPDHRDARFHLAIDQLLLGRGAEAEQNLRAFLQEETGGWRLALAYQELARMQLAQQLPGAVRTLREGLERCPGDEKLIFLLAALLDRTGQGGEARQLIASFKPQEGEGGGAARRHYSSPPEEPLATLNADFGREAANHLPALAAALEGTR